MSLCVSLTSKSSSEILGVRHFGDIGETGKAAAQSALHGPLWYEETHTYICTFVHTHTFLAYLFLDHYFLPKNKTFGFGGKKIKDMINYI